MQTGTWDFFVALRKEILGTITGIQNAGSDLHWDNTTPNYVTKGRLKEIRDAGVREAAAFGVYVVTRHSACGRNGHREYLMTDSYGLGVTYHDERYFWGGGQMFQGSRSEACPCSAEREPVSHYVIDDIIYDPQCERSICCKIEDILVDVNSAIDAADDKRPRSAIREYLLRAVIRLNDAILPIKVDEYITQRQAGR